MLLSGQFGILTGENPRFPPLYAHRNLGLEAELRSMGLQFTPITGRYDCLLTEHSFIVRDISQNELVRLGRDFGQESVIFSCHGNNKMIYTNGPNAGRYHAGVGMVVFQSAPEMYYSTIMHDGNPVHFSLNLDFGSLLS